MHARHNTTSVYTSGEMFPLLPEKLSTDLTSLGEGQDRLAIVVEFVVAEDGAVLGSSLFRALVHNHAKLAYNSVAAWLTGRGPRRSGSRPYPASMRNSASRTRFAAAQDSTTSAGRPGS